MGGGTSLEVLTRLALLENAVQNLNQTLSEKLGIDKVVQSTSVTESGYAVDARELNASVTGTIANLIQNLNLNVVGMFKSYAYIDRPFDFNDPTIPAGIYRIQTGDMVLNRPANVSVDWGNVMVIKANGWDTLAMVVFTLTQGIYFRSGVVGNWTDFPWEKITSIIL